MRLEARNISFRYSSKDNLVLNNVSLSIESGERVGLTGPSGCGKSTLAKILSGYENPVSGEVFLDGKPLPKRGICPVQLIYQHPEKALNPRWKMKQALNEPGSFSADTLKQLSIETEWLNRYPRELSGGELQRFCVARALFESTRILIADEISTMLDVITQAQIWEFVLSEAERRNLGLLVVTHNQNLADRVCTKIIDLERINEQ